MHKSLVLGWSFLSIGCTRALPPPAAPAEQKVELEVEPIGPIRAGAGRVVLDAEEGKGEVRVIRVERTELHLQSWPRYAHGVGVSTSLVCSKTPCAVDLPAGSHQLVFQAKRDARDVSEATLDVTAGRSHVVRHAVGRVDPHVGWKLVGINATLLGVAATGAGAALLPLSSSIESDGMRTAGFVTLGTGLGLLTLGIVSLILGRTEWQPGSTTQWMLERTDEQRPAPNGDRAAPEVPNRPAFQSN